MIWSRKNNDWGPEQNTKPIVEPPTKPVITLSFAGPLKRIQKSRLPTICVEPQNTLCAVCVQFVPPRICSLFVDKN